MNGITRAVAAGIAAGALVYAVGSLVDPTGSQAATVAGTPATPAALTVNSSGADGNPARYAPFVELQQTGDCVEQSALVAMSALSGRWVASRAGIDFEALKLGVGAADVYAPLDRTADGGPVVEGSYVTPAIFQHYGFKATAPKPMSRATVMKDLAAGDSVQATVYAGDLWGTWDATSGAVTPGAVVNPSGYDTDLTPNPDHAVVVEAVNKSTYAVTIGDTGFGGSYTISWSAFSRAWSTGGYSAIAVSVIGKG